MFTFLDEYSNDVKGQINSKKTINMLLKSYIFETYTSTSKSKKIELAQLFALKKFTTVQIDEELFLIKRGNETIGFVEKVDERFSILYSIDKAQRADILTNLLVKQFPVLDNLWISGKMFDYFWDNIQSEHMPHRYIKLKFEYDGFFEVLQGYNINNEENIDEDEILDDQRITSISLVEELDNLRDKIDQVRLLFPAFFAVGLLRFPSLVGKGGHDFYRHGKVTNRSESFNDHRYQIISTVKQYKHITVNIESDVWLKFDKFTSDKLGVKMEGSPVVFKFSKRLQEKVFLNFVNYTFPTGKEPFRILGSPIWVNENKVHIYGNDIHLWQKVLMELSREEFVVILPRGTCGNTIHRLVTNIQRFLDPAVDVFIGDQRYEKFLRSGRESDV